MKILIHAGKGEKKSAVLQRRIQYQLPKIQICRSREPADLVWELGQPLNRISVIILFTPTLEALNALFHLRSFFENKKLILVLPGQDNQAVIRGLQLNPSFINTSDDPGENIIMVLKRINQRQQTTTQISMHLKNTRK